MIISVIILAAGKGTRMQSKLPKVLHDFASKPLLHRILDMSAELNPAQQIVVCGHAAAAVQTATRDYDKVDWVLQEEQLGTGHAVMVALSSVKEKADGVLILYGDVPLLQATTVKKLLDSTPPHGFGILTANVKDPTGLGRIIRGEQGRIIKIVEEKDATCSEKKITEINPGVYWIKKSHLQKWLSRLRMDNAQKELYLTDLISIAISENVEISSVEVECEEEILGVNTRQQLVTLERFYQRQLAEIYMSKGVTIRDPDRFDVRGELVVKQDIIIDVNVIFEGHVTLEENVEIGPNCYIKDSIIEAGTKILANTVIESAVIHQGCVIGPFARIRPGSEFSKNAKVGNFVETKNVKLGERSKCNHLSYVGDADIGNDVNIGAGTITCNYDGANKHKTIIEDNVFIGSDSQLIAPVVIGQGATIAAGTTVTKDILPHHLTLNKKEFTVVKDWKRPQKNQPEK